MGILSGAIGSGLGSLVGGLFGRGKEGGAIGHDVAGWLPLARGGRVHRGKKVAVVVVAAPKRRAKKAKKGKARK